MIIITLIITMRKIRTIILVIIIIMITIKIQVLVV